MYNVSKKTVILTILLVLLAAVSIFAAKLTAKADVDAATIASQLTPRRTEYGQEKEGECYIYGGTVYKNYDYGCVTATLGADNSIMNMRSHGGVNYSDSTHKMEFLKDGDDYKLKEMILSRGVEGGIQTVWNRLAVKFDSEVYYDMNNKNAVLMKIYEKYVKLCEEGYNCGIATGELSVWDDSVIKLDFYDGDSEYGFGETDGRVYVTTIAYSFLNDEAYAISGKFFNFYRDAKAGSLSEPITDVFEYTENGVKGTVQAFALGYIFCPDGSNNLTVRAGTRWNEEEGKFKVLELSPEELTVTAIDDKSLQDSPYYSEFTIDEVKDLFYNKYLELIKSGFNPGIPDHEGIFYWDTELLKQAYVGSDGTGNAWGRTNMMLILNPYDKKVYAVYGEILNLVDKAAHGLGNARSLGYPTCDPTEYEVNGLTYTYQNFIRPYYRDEQESTIYTIEETKQLTRHIVGSTFEEFIKSAQNNKPNNPLYFYVVEPWVIGLICAAPVVLAGAGVAVYFFVFRKKKLKKAAADGSAETTVEEEVGE